MAARQRPGLRSKVTIENSVMLANARSDLVEPVRCASYSIDHPRSHMINRADHCAGFDRSAIHHNHAGQNACGRRLEFVREIISINLDNGLTEADRIANALEPSPDIQVRGTCNLRYLYF